MISWKSLILIAILGGAGASMSTSLTEEVQSFRSRHSLSIPQWSRALEDSCLIRARVLVQEGQLTHLDDEGRNAARQAIDQGLSLGEYGEILGAGPSWQLVWKAWIASPTHKAVLMESGWQQWAYASVSGTGTTVWVVRFWKP